MRFDELTKKMYLDRFYPGTTPGEILDNTGFSMDIDHAKLFDPPTAEELRILRQEVDPQRLILGND
jgi:glutaconate CoA-transferase subunit B